MTEKYGGACWVQGFESGIWAVEEYGSSEVTENYHHCAPRENSGVRTLRVACTRY